MTQFAQVQTNEPLHFNKPFILVTRIGNNEGNDTYHNPTQRYYEFDSMITLFKAASRFSRDEQPISALQVAGDGIEYDQFGTPITHYFHNFTAALDEYKRGIRVEM